MSFISLLANDIWPDADITRRTEAMVRTEFSQEAETILNRKVAGMSLGQYVPTQDDLDEMARFKVVVDAAHDEGVAARADMALLLDTMAYETAMKRLAQPLPPEDATDEEKAQDAAERAEAQAVVDGASQAVIDLYALRNPPAPPAPETAPELELEPEPIVEAE
jgi:hypothetical protein